MRDLDRRRFVFVCNGKGRAGDAAPVAESVQHAARECGLAGTEVAGERNNVACLEAFGVFCAECFGLLG